MNSELCFVLFSLLAANTPMVTEIRVGDAEGEPGEIVDVPVIASFSDPICSFTIVLNWDSERLEFLGWTSEGTASAGSEMIARFWEELEPGVGYFGLSPPRANPQCVFELEANDGVVIAKALFRILSTAAIGNAFVKPVASVESGANVARRR